MPLLQHLRSRFAALALVIVLALLAAAPLARAQQSAAPTGPVDGTTRPAPSPRVDSGDANAVGPNAELARPQIIEHVTREVFEVYRGQIAERVQAVVSEAMRGRSRVEPSTMEDLVRAETRKTFETLQIESLTRKTIEAELQRSGVLSSEMAAGWAAALVADWQVSIRDDVQRTLRETLRRNLNLVLRPFGHELFSRAVEQKPSSLGPVQQVEDYELRPSDRLRLQVYNVKGGESAEALQLDRSGNAFVPGIGLVNMSGLTLNQAQGRVTDSLRKRFPNMRARLFLESAPSLAIYVVGEARRPGRYELPAGATLMDALLVAGGPSDVGSYRAIRVLRGSQVVTVTDLYALLAQGIATDTVRLRGGDRVFIPARGPEVAVDGEVVRPALYELKGERTLAQIVKLAGGIMGEAYAPRLQIERISKHRDRVLLDLEYSAAATTAVQAGDRISVLSVLPDPRNGITLDGQVQRPGVFAYVPGMRVAALIRRAQGMRVGVFAGHAEVYRMREGKPPEVIGFDLERALQGDEKENVALRPGDKVLVYDTSQVSFKRTRVRINGAVTRPGEYNRYVGMTVRDLIYQAGGLLPEASTEAEVARIDPASGRLSLVPIRLDASLDGADAAFRLEDMDVLVVRTDIGRTRWPSVVSVRGEVTHPGDYAFDSRHETLRDLVKRAGGLSPDADARAAMLIRFTDGIIDPQRLQLTSEAFDTLQSVARQMAVAEAARLGVTQAQTSGAGGPAGAVVEALKGSPRAVIAPRLISRILSSGRIAIDLPRILATGQGDPGVREGDVLYIPRPSRLVVVSGAVTMPSALPWMAGWRVRDYVARSGDFTPDALRNGILVMRANGEMSRVNENAAIEEGDLVLVPPKAIIAQPSAWDRFLEGLRILTSGAVLYQLFR